MVHIKIKRPNMSSSYKTVSYIEDLRELCELIGNLYEFI